MLTVRGYLSCARLTLFASHGHSVQILEVKALAKRHLPNRYLLRRVRRHQQRVRRGAGVPQLARSFAASHGAVVRGGPFAGLEYSHARIDQIDAPVAKLLGSYESELHGVVGDALRVPPSTFIDIGAADGYYAVGFALKSPRTTVHAFEVDAWARKRLAELAALNRVADRVSVRKACTADALCALAPAQAFVISDCEGAEVEIFTPEVARRLGDSTVLIELHDQQLGFDALSVLEPRFAPSHAVTEIRNGTRDPDRFPELAHLPERDRRIALEELRGGAMQVGPLHPRSMSSGGA